MVTPLRWMASVLYAAVLVTGVYYALAGLSPGWSGWALAGFMASLAALPAVEQVARKHPEWAVGLLIARMVLIEAVAATDAAGFGRVLCVLVPYFAYFSLGRRWSIGLAGGYLVAAVVRVSSTPSWWHDPEIVSDLLMLFIGMLLSVVTAAVAAQQQRSRIVAEQLVSEVSASHRRLADYAGRVAELSAVSERNRMARDIHDSVGHHLTAVGVQLAKAEAFRDRDPAVADRAVRDARRAAGRALAEVRESVSALRITPFLLTPALESLAEGLDDVGFRISLECGGEAPAPGLEELYRVAQEALTNARRHAEASEVRVTVQFGPTVTLDVIDNGRGFVVGEAAGGNGLAGMRERMDALGGSLRIESEPGHGTRVTACLPALLLPRVPSLPPSRRSDQAAGRDSGVQGVSRGGMSVVGVGDD